MTWGKAALDVFVVVTVHAPGEAVVTFAQKQHQPVVEEVDFILGVYAEIIICVEHRAEIALLK